MQEKLYLKGINGLRAIAAISVVVFHINHSLVQFNLPNLRSIDLAGYGVTIFFAISGFLITLLLLKEKEGGNIDVKKFYVRRVLRIWPLYFLFLILSVTTALYYHIGDFPGSLLYYIFLAANIPFIVDMTLPFLGHYWSLGVEEQFYLFWPWMIRTQKNVLRLVIVFTVIFILFRVLFRFIEYRYGYSLPYLIMQVTRFDCMSIGAIGAILLHQNNRAFLRISQHVFTQLISWAVIVLLMFNKYHIASVIDSDIVSIITVFLIINVSINEKRLIGLDYPFFDFLGKISFGIYVVHQLVIFYYAKFLNLFTMEPLYKFPLIYGGVLALTILVSYISYEYFEKRFLRIKERYMIVKSTSSVR